MEDLDRSDFEFFMKQANEMAKTYQHNRLQGRFIWDKERIEEIKSYSLEELICDDYFLGLKNDIRPSVLEDIYELWEERKKRRIHIVCFEEGIGSGKTTKASIILWLQWLEITLHETPQKYFGIEPASKIAFVCSSRTEAQARRVAFSKVWARFVCPFNRDYFPPNPRYSAEIQIKRNNTAIYAGNSSALSVQGFDYYGGIMDECNSMEYVEDSKRAFTDDNVYDAAEELESAIFARMTSRFFEKAGMLVCVSSTVHEDDFLRRKKREWEAYGDDSFIFYKSKMLSDVFAVSDKLPFSNYNKNVCYRFKPEEGYFYIDVDTIKEVSEDIANAYFMFIERLRNYKEEIMKKWHISEKDYMEIKDFKEVFELEDSKKEG